MALTMVSRSATAWAAESEKNARAKPLKDGVPANPRPPVPGRAEDGPHGNRKVLLRGAHRPRPRQPQETCPQLLPPTIPPAGSRRWVLRPTEAGPRHGRRTL